MMPEKLMKIMQNAEVQEAMQIFMLNDLEKQKKNTFKKYKMLNRFVKKGQILFVGSSLMEWFPISEMQLTLDLDYIIYNRGVAGATTSDLLNAMNECIFDLEPSKIFINIGSNDIGSIGQEVYNKESLLSNYDIIMRQIHRRLPECEVYIMAYYPINSEVDFGLDKFQKDDMFSTRTNDNIIEANEGVAELARKHGFTFINVNEGLTDEKGNLKAEFSIEGMHLWPNAYSVIFENMKKYL